MTEEDKIRIEKAKKGAKFILEKTFFEIGDHKTIVKTCIKNLLQPNHPLRPKKLIQITSKFGLVYDVVKEELIKSHKKNEILYDKLNEVAIFVLENDRKNHKGTDPLVNLYRNYNITFAVESIVSDGFTPINPDEYGTISASEVVANVICELGIESKMSSKTVKEIRENIKATQEKILKLRSHYIAAVVLTLNPSLLRVHKTFLFELFLGHHLFFEAG